MPAKKLFTAALLAALTMLAGCSSAPKDGSEAKKSVLGGSLENRLACAVNGDSLWVLSRWGPFAIGTEIAARDAETFCERMGSPTPAP